MRKRTLRSLLMDRCFWRAATVVCVVIMIQLVILSIWQANRNPGVPTDFSSDAHAGCYAQLAIIDISDSFAQKDGDTFYFLMDLDEYVYVAVLSSQQLYALRSELADGTAEVTVTGTTMQTPNLVRQQACSFFGNMNVGDYEKYFGPSYLDCTCTPYTDASVWMMLGAILAALMLVPSLIIWLRRRGRVARSLRRIERLGKLNQAAEQLQNALPEQMAGALTVTEDFFCDGRMGTLYLRGEMKNIELRRFSWGRARLMAKVGGVRRTVARLSSRQRLRLPELLKPSATMLVTGNFAAPRYWQFPDSSSKGEY